MSEFTKAIISNIKQEKLSDLPQDAPSCTFSDWLNQEILKADEDYENASEEQCIDCGIAEDKMYYYTKVVVLKSVLCKYKSL